MGPFACVGLIPLVEDGTITQAQADAVREAMTQYMRDHRPAFGRGETPPGLRSDGPLATVLQQLVKDGTITQAQATAITNAAQEHVRARWADASGTGPHGRTMMGRGTAPPWAESSSS